MVEQSYYSQILDTLTTAVVVLGSDMLIAHVNASAESLLGSSQDQVVGKPVSYLFPSTHGTPRSLKDALAENAYFTKRKARWKLKNLQEITLDYTVTPAPEIGMTTIEIQRVLLLSNLGSHFALDFCDRACP